MICPGRQESLPAGRDDQVGGALPLRQRCPEEEMSTAELWETLAGPRGSEESDEHGSTLDVEGGAERTKISEVTNELPPRTPRNTW